MKVIKSILIAVVLGIVYVGIGLMKIDNIKMSEILLANTMSGVEFYPQYISTFSFEYNQLKMLICIVDNIHLLS